MMKKYLLTGLFIWISLAASAQDIISMFLDKHGKDDNLEIISIGKKMMEMMDTLTFNSPDLKEAIKGLDAIRIVSSKDMDVNKEYFNSAQKLLSGCKGLKEIFSTDDKEKELMVMVRELKGIIKELILLTEQTDIFNLISISGTIDLDVLLKYSEGLNIKNIKDLNLLRSAKSNK